MLLRAIFVGILGLGLSFSAQAVEKFSCVSENSTFEILLEERVIDEPVSYRNGVVVETVPVNVLYFVAKNARGERVAETPVRSFAGENMVMGLIQQADAGTPKLTAFAFLKRDLKLYIGDFRVSNGTVKLHNSGQRTYNCSISK